MLPAHHRRQDHIHQRPPEKLPSLRPQWSLTEIRQLEQALLQHGSDLNAIQQALGGESAYRSKGALYRKLFRVMQDANRAGIGTWTCVPEFAASFKSNPSSSFLDLVCCLSSHKLSHKPSRPRHATPVIEHWNEHRLNTPESSDTGSSVLEFFYTTVPTTPDVKPPNLVHRLDSHLSTHTPQGMAGRELNLDDVNAFVHRSFSDLQHPLIHTPPFSSADSSIELPHNHPPRKHPRPDPLDRSLDPILNSDTNLFTNADLVSQFLDLSSPSPSLLELFRPLQPQTQAQFLPAPSIHDQLDLAFLFGDQFPNLDSCS